MNPKFSVTFKRFIAALIDLIITYFYMFFVTRMLELGLNEENVDTKLPFSMFLLVIGFALCGFQFYFRDWIYCGRSLGKRLFKLIIVSTDDWGRPSDVSTGKKLLRQLFVWLLLPVEFFVLLFTGKTLGDRVSQTMVISEKDYEEYCAIFDEIRNQNPYYSSRPNYESSNYGRAESSEPPLTREVDLDLLSDNYSPLYDFPINDTPSVTAVPEAEPPKVAEEQKIETIAPAQEETAENTIFNTAENIDQPSVEQAPPQVEAPRNIYSSGGTPYPNVGHNPYANTRPYNYQRTSNDRTASNVVKIVAISLTCLVLLVAAVIGICVGSLSAVMDTPEYEKAYNYVITSRTFKNLGATMNDISFAGYSANTNLSAIGDHKKSVKEYTFVVKGATLTVVFHEKDNKNTICVECTGFN